jgi:hypothetical protein
VTEGVRKREREREKKRGRERERERDSSGRIEGRRWCGGGEVEVSDTRPPVPPKTRSTIHHYDDVI